MGYNPIQLNRNIDYTEVYPSLSLRNNIAYYWEIRTNNLSANYPIIPDGCVDLVVNCNEDNQIYVSPTVIAPEVVRLNKEETWFGIRFYPGIISDMLGVDLSALKFQIVDLNDINKLLSNKIKKILNNTKSITNRADKLNQLFTKIVLDKRSNDTIKVLKIVDQIYLYNGNYTLSDKSINISERHLRRLFNQKVGTSPKRFSRIIRSQHFLNELKSNRKTKSYYSSYFDQAHMIKEIKEMTGYTPKQLVRD